MVNKLKSNKNVLILVTFGTAGHCDNCFDSQLLALDTNINYDYFTIYASIYLYKLCQKFEKNGINKYVGNNMNFTNQLLLYVYFKTLGNSPVFSHTNASLQGLATIRAFGATEAVRNEFYNHLDYNTEAWFLKSMTTRAFSLWLDLVCLLYITTVTFSFVIFNTSGKSHAKALFSLRNINNFGLCQYYECYVSVLPSKDNLAGSWR